MMRVCFFATEVVQGMLILCLSKADSWPDFYLARAFRELRKKNGQNNHWKYNQLNTPLLRGANHIRIRIPLQIHIDSQTHCTDSDKYARVGYIFLGELRKLLLLIQKPPEIICQTRVYMHWVRVYAHLYLVQFRGEFEAHSILWVKTNNEKIVWDDMATLAKSFYHHVHNFPLQNCQRF